MTAFKDQLTLLRQIPKPPGANSPEELETEVVPHAALRQYRNRYTKTNDGIVNDADYLGVLGERAVCEFFRLDPAEYVQSERRTPGWFLEIAGLKIKAFATRHPDHIIVKEGAVHADVYILVYVHKTGDWCSCLGYATREQILAAPISTYSGGAYALPSHWHRRQDDRPMQELIDRIDAALGTTREERRAILASASVSD